MFREQHKNTSQQNSVHSVATFCVIYNPHKRRAFATSAHQPSNVHQHGLGDHYKPTSKGGLASERGEPTRWKRRPKKFMTPTFVGVLRANLSLFVHVSPSLWFVSMTTGKLSTVCHAKVTENAKPSSPIRATVQRVCAFPREGRGNRALIENVQLFQKCEFQI